MLNHSERSELQSSEVHFRCYSLGGSSPPVKLLRVVLTARYTGNENTLLRNVSSQMLPCQFHVNKMNNGIPLVNLVLVHHTCPPPEL